MEELQQENKRLQQKIQTLQAGIAIAMIAMLVAFGIGLGWSLFWSIRLGVYYPGFFGRNSAWIALLIGIIIGYLKLRKPHHFYDRKDILKFSLLWGGISGILGVIGGNLTSFIFLYISYIFS